MLKLTTRSPPFVDTLMGDCTPKWTLTTKSWCCHSCTTAEGFIFNPSFISGNLIYMPFQLIRFIDTFVSVVPAVPLICPPWQYRSMIGRLRFLHSVGTRVGYIIICAHIFEIKHVAHAQSHQTPINNSKMRAICRQNFTLSPGAQIMSQMTNASAAIAAHCTQPPSEL